MNKITPRDVLLFVGFGLFVGGASWYSPPMGLVAAGFMLMLGAAKLARLE